MDLTTALVAVIVLTIIFWVLVRLREMREQTKEASLPTDETTILLGIFYGLSQACINHHRDHGNYPEVVSGAHDGLVETGYLKNVEDLEAVSSIIPLFTIVLTEKGGRGICLSNTTRDMAQKIIGRVNSSSHELNFCDFQGDKYHVLDDPISSDYVNLTLPLPVRPSELKTEEPAPTAPTTPAT